MTDKRKMRVNGFGFYLNRQRTKYIPTISITTGDDWLRIPFSRHICIEQLIKEYQRCEELNKGLKKKRREARKP